MTELYSIGKMSSMMGISTQVLRHYCDIGLIVPEYIDPDTGYRFFSFSQFHYIDRARYLLKCGFRLSEIKEILGKDNVDFIIGQLHNKQIETEKAIDRANMILKTLKWYEEYFVSGESEASMSCYLKRFDTRWLLAIHCGPGYRHKDFYPLFSEIRKQPDLAAIPYKRQFTSILDYQELLQARRKRYHVGMFALEKPACASPHILEIPGGDYWCFKAPILSEHWNPCVLQMLVEEHGAPKLLLACEYENSLSSYHECPHEVQILF